MVWLSSMDSQNTMLLEFGQSIEFKVENERPLGIAHMVLFIVQ